MKIEYIVSDMRTTNTLERDVFVIVELTKVKYLTHREKIEVTVTPDHAKSITIGDRKVLEL